MNLPDRFQCTSHKQHFNSLEKYAPQSLKNRRNLQGEMGKICATIAISLFSTTQAMADNVAIIGGIDLTSTDPAYAALVSSSGDLTPLVDISLTGAIQSVSMNGSFESLIGGYVNDGSSTPAYAALVSSSGELTSLIFTGPIAMHGTINSVGINNSGNGIIGGRDTTGPIYAALVPPTGNPLVPLVFPDPINSGGIINTVSINNSGNSLIGGQGYYDTQPAFAALVSSSGTITPLILTGGIATTGVINSVAINSSGNGILGGRDTTGSQPAYAALVSSDTVTPLVLAGDISTTGSITSVAINSSGKGIIGGQDLTGTQPGYAAIVSSGTVSPLTLTGGMTENGIINAVAINSSGNGIIGGQDLTGSQPAYVALVSSGTVTPLTLTGGGMATNGVIYSVAIDSSGNGIVGGWDLTGSQPAYAALVTSSGTVVPLTFTGGIATSGWINSVALPLSLLNAIPTTSLSGNNLIFANYINEFSSENAVYFVPSETNGTLNSALQSAAPTRNGVLIYTASNNLFNLTTTFSNHARNLLPKKIQPQKNSTTVAENELPAEELQASLSLRKKAKTNPPNENLWSIWFDAIGALAFQRSQEQTVGVNPTTGGAILAFDRTVIPKVRVGGGISYLYTHIHEKEGQGHSNINQEEAFIYTSWDNRRFYIDALLMGGAAQISQSRNTIMTGFSFHSSSHRNGWQLLPHLELGYRKNVLNQSVATEFYLNPFVMLDWANAWQESYKEKGDNPFNAAQKSYYGSLLRSEAGLRFYELLYFQTWNLSIQEKLSYVNTQSFNGGKVNAFLVGSPGSFVVETLSSSQNLGVAQVAFTFDPVNNRYPTSTLFYQGEFGPRYQSHQLNIELAWRI